MMIGNNELILNLAEMKQAVEYYLNKKQFKEEVCVDNVQIETVKVSERCFRITLTEPNKIII